LFFLEKHSSKILAFHATIIDIAPPVEYFSNQNRSRDTPTLLKFDLYPSTVNYLRRMLDNRTASREFFHIA